MTRNFGTMQYIRSTLFHASLVNSDFKTGKQVNNLYREICR
jgi:hypothetical protein